MDPILLYLVLKEKQIFQRSARYPNSFRLSAVSLLISLK